MQQEIVDCERCDLRSCEAVIEVETGKLTAISLVVDLEKSDHVLLAIDDRHSQTGFHPESVAHLRKNHRVLFRIIGQIVSPMLNEPASSAHSGCAMVRQRYHLRPLKEVATRHPLRGPQTCTTTLGFVQVKKLFDQQIQQIIQIRRRVQLGAHAKETP